MARRALGDKEKEERRGDILSLAGSLLAHKSYEEIRMADIAADLGLAKGTLYLYFPSKESLFLSLLAESLDQALQRILEVVSQPQTSIDAIASVASSFLAQNPTLPRLLAMVHSVLEQNVPWEEAVAFKRRLADFIQSAASGIAGKVPGLGPQEATKFFLYLYAQIVGLVQLTDISPFMARIGAEPGLGVFRLGLEETLKDSARAILIGLVSGQPPSPAP